MAVVTITEEARKVRLLLSIEGLGLLDGLESLDDLESLDFLDNEYLNAPNLQFEIQLPQVTQRE